MIPSLKQAWLSWDETRAESLSFLESLRPDQLRRRMPRPGLNTFGAHFQELGAIQRAFARALDELRMDFAYMEFTRDDVLANDPQRLKAFLNECNEEFQKAIGRVKDPNAIVEWPLPRKPTALEHVYWLMQHETFHHGQMIAFCYVMGIQIPEALATHWNMPAMSEEVVKVWIEEARRNAKK